jgi:hypothetical protein
LKKEANIKLREPFTDESQHPVFGRMGRERKELA